MEMAGPQPFRFRYTRKDLILYALSIGMGGEESGADEDLRFLYEQHPMFVSLPMFCLSFTFWADQQQADQTSGRIPNFPPPMMANEELIPKKFLRKGVVLSNYPVIHTWQSMVWERSLPTPIDNKNSVSTSINLRTISVQPKSIGVFVTTHSEITAMDSLTNQESLVCTMQSTALVFGISKDDVSPFDDGSAKLTFKPKTPHGTMPDLEWTHATQPNQALLYRMASGDSNHIHVDTSASQKMGSSKKAPLLHGLFSLAIAFRGILKVVPDADGRIRRLEARFVQPAFVGDVLKVRVWLHGRSQLLFEIVNHDTGVVLVDCGCAELRESGSRGIDQSRL